MYHRECFKCSECDAEISASADQDALIGDIPESLTSSTSSTSSGSMSTFEVSFNMEAGPNNRVSRGCAKIVCGDHVGPEAEHASASVCTHVNLGDHVYGAACAFVFVCAHAHTILVFLCVTGIVQ